MLDNFGSTGLSLASLRELPLTGVKLDRSLTAELGGDDRLVVATVRLATRLGLHCTAVGIETRSSSRRHGRSASTPSRVTSSGGPRAGRRRTCGRSPPTRCTRSPRRAPRRP